MNTADQAVIKDGEEEIGGFQRNPRPNGKKPLDKERPGKNKTPRRQEIKEIVTTQKKNLEEEMKNNENPGIAQTRPEFEICPLCGFFNKSVKDAENGERMKYLVCKGDADRYNTYAKKVAEQILAGEKPEILSKPEWVLHHLDIGRFERELEDARKKRVNPAKRLAELLRQAGNGKDLPPEIHSVLEPKYREQANREDKEGYYLVRRLNARLLAARELKPELEQMVAEAAKKAAEPVPKPVNNT